MFRDYAMPLLIPSFMLQGDNLHSAAECMSTHAKYLLGKQNHDQMHAATHTPPHVLPPQSPFPLLLCKHLQTPIATFQILSLFHYLIPLPLFSLMTCALVIFSLLTVFGGGGDGNHKLAPCTFCGTHLKQSIYLANVVGG